MLTCKPTCRQAPGKLMAVSDIVGRQIFLHFLHDQRGSHWKQSLSALCVHIFSISTRFCSTTWVFVQDLNQALSQSTCLQSRWLKHRKTDCLVQGYLHISLECFTLYVSPFQNFQMDECTSRWYWHNIITNWCPPQKCKYCTCTVRRIGTVAGGSFLVSLCAANSLVRSHHW